MEEKKEKHPSIKPKKGLYLPPRLRSYFEQWLAVQKSEGYKGRSSNWIAAALIWFFESCPDPEKVDLVNRARDYDARPITKEIEPIVKASGAAALLQKKARNALVEPPAASTRRRRSKGGAT